VKEHFRGVIWPRGEAKQKDLPKVYRYMVIGLLVTDEPIEGIEGKNEIVVDGPKNPLSAAMSDVLQGLKQKKPAFKLGDANQVLTNLEYIVDED